MQKSVCGIIEQRLLFLALTVSVLTGCAQAEVPEVPGCNAKQTRETLNHLANLGYQRVGVDYKYDHSINMVRTRKIESSTGMRECAANFIVSNSKSNKSITIPIVYYVLLLDDSKELLIENENLVREMSDILFLGRLN